MKKNSLTRSLFGVICCVLCLAGLAHATIFGGVRGLVHDPQHRPIQSAQVTLKAQDSDYAQSQQSNEGGEFAFNAVPVGNYRVTVTMPGFQRNEQAVIVQSDSSPVLHFELQLAGINQTTVVQGAPTLAAAESVTPMNMLSREDIQAMPGADQTNSLAMITDIVPGAYMVHDQLHIRGGHQISWLVDGVPVPNTDIASNVGPQFDPKDIDYIEMQRGSYDAGYGDRTYGVFNVLPRTGFERDRECDAVVSFGSFYQTNDQMSCGGHSERLAYYGSLSGNRSDLGLETPTLNIIHDAVYGYSGFGSLIFNANPRNQLRVVASLRRDIYQIPNTPDQQEACTADEIAADDIGDACSLRDTQRESDVFVNLSWVRTFNSKALLTVSPFYHYNSANYDGGASDFPSSTTDDRKSNYVGAQTTFGDTLARNTFQVGYYGFWQRDNHLFGLQFNGASEGSPLVDREIVAGNVQAVFLQDKFAPTSWLTLSGGVRQTHFSSNFAEDVTSPRAGVSVQIPRIRWVFRGFYGQFYQAPPLLTASGPLLEFVTNQSLDFIALHGERDTEYQFGVTVPFRSWSLDIDTFHTLAHNFFDHNNVGNSDIFFPLTVQEARIRGWELTLRSPRLWHRLQLHTAYSNQIAEFMGAVTGGLTDFSFQDGFAPLDHDQRNTLNVGFESTLPRETFVSGNVYYGSGFTNGDGPSSYLPGHATLDLSAGKSFGERFTVSVNALNVTDSHLLIDNSFTFGGVHFNNPREIYGEVRYRFHY